MAEVTETKPVETKTQRVERLKRSKNAWDHFDEIQQFARDGFDSIPPEWLGTYFRSWGVYTQGDGAGVTGGKNGEGKALPFFMVRIRIPNGLLRTEQVRTIARLAEKYGRGVADITVRQNIQLHWVAIESLPDVLQSLWNVGLTTTGACGDVARNITGCPLAGLDGEEIIDASPLALAIDRELGGNSEFYNLPRKFKISITGCRHWCSYPEINDIGLTATTRQRNGKHEVGFTLRVGGGLSTNPHLAVPLDAFIKPEQVVRVVRGVAEIFRASELLRQSRERARLKFLFLEHGWTAESFLADLQQRIGFSLEPGEREDIPADIHRDHVGVHDQKQAGLVYVGASVLRGRITPQQLNLAADLADRYADGHVRNTVMQNLLIVNVRKESASLVAAELTAAGLPVKASVFARGTISCTGSEFCKLALTETKASRAGSPRNWKSACPLLKSSSSCTLPAAPTVAASTGSPTSVSKGKKSSRMAAWSTPITSASAAAWDSLLPSRGRLDTAARPPRCPMPSNACSKASTPCAKATRICASFSTATVMTSYERCWRANLSVPSSAIWRSGPCRMAWKARTPEKS